MALGLGKYIVDGGQTLRVCPFHPHQVLQMSEMEIALRETQTQFYALDMKHISEDFKVDDGFNILKLRVKDAEADGSLQYITSTYSPETMLFMMDSTKEEERLSLSVVSFNRTSFHYQSCYKWQ